MKRMTILAFALLAHSAWATDVKVSNAWLRATVPGQQVAGAFMDITSPVNASLIGAKSDVAGSMEVHSMSMKNGVMEMREIKALPLPKAKLVKLSPGTFHLMLFDLKQPMKAGELVPIQLIIETADKKHEVVKVNALVRDMSGAMAH